MASLSIPGPGPQSGFPPGGGARPRPRTSHGAPAGPPQAPSSLTSLVAIHKIRPGSRANRACTWGGLRSETQPPGAPFSSAACHSFVDLPWQMSLESIKGCTNGILWQPPAPPRPRPRPSTSSCPRSPRLLTSARTTHGPGINVIRLVSLSVSLLCAPRPVLNQQARMHMTQRCVPFEVPLGRLRSHSSNPIWGKTSANPSH